MLLALDTSTRWIGLALYDGIVVHGEQIWQTKDHHTVELADAVDHLLVQTAIQSEALKAIAIATGPGSFTSLRIGLALAKGMALTLDIPLIGVPSLEILAGVIPVEDHPLIAVLQAGRGRLAAVKFRAESKVWRSSSQPVVCDLKGLFEMMEGPTLMAGELDAGPPGAAERKAFRDALTARLGQPTIWRYSGGAEIGAACGMLSGDAAGELSESAAAGTPQTRRSSR